jgi:hypothetical protein
MNTQSNITGSANGATRGGIKDGIGTHDPLLDTIDKYQRQIDAFNTASYDTDDEAFAAAEATYSPTWRILRHWFEPARSRDGAIAAIKAAHREMCGEVDDDFSIRMLAAAIAFFDAEERAGGAMNPEAPPSIDDLNVLHTDASLIEVQLNKISGTLRAMDALSERFLDDRDAEAMRYLIENVIQAVEDIDTLRMEIFIGLKAELRGRAN